MACVVPLVAALLWVGHTNMEMFGGDQLHHHSLSHLFNSACGMHAVLVWSVGGGGGLQ